jgi:hypothetical protein
MGKLGYCKSCKTYWYLDIIGSKIYPFFNEQLDNLTRWNSKNLIVDRKMFEILEKIKATPIVLSAVQRNCNYVERGLINRITKWIFS